MKTEKEEIQQIAELLDVFNDPIDPNDSRFKFQIDDIVIITDKTIRIKEGFIAQILHRRSAYGSYWTPIYYLKSLDPLEKEGGEIGEGCFRLATKEEIDSIKTK